jgi:hypothetical protein
MDAYPMLPPIVYVSYLQEIYGVSEVVGCADWGVLIGVLTDHDIAMVGNVSHRFS